MKRAMFMTRLGLQKVTEVTERLQNGARASKSPKLLRCLGYSVYDAPRVTEVTELFNSL